MLQKIQRSDLTQFQPALA